MASEQENIKFAQFIEKYPCLYDNACKGYSNKNTTEKAWHEVAAEFKLTVKECKDKWEDIRTVFRRHVFVKPPSGSGVASKKEYYMSDVLQFLIPISKCNNKVQTGNLPPPPEPTVHHDDNDDDTRDGTITEEDTQTADAEVNDPESITELADTRNAARENPNETISEFRRNQSRKRKSNDALDEAVTDYFKAKAVCATSRGTAVVTSSSQSDEQFLLSLKEDMKEMNPNQKRQFKRRIYDVIEDMLAGGSAVSNSNTQASSTASVVSSRSLPTSTDTIHGFRLENDYTQENAVFSMFLQHL